MNGAGGGPAFCGLASLGWFRPWDSSLHTSGPQTYMRRLPSGASIRVRQQQTLADPRPWDVAFPVVCWLPVNAPSMQAACRLVSAQQPAADLASAKALAEDALAMVLEPLAADCLDAELADRAEADLAALDLWHGDGRAPLAPGDWARAWDDIRAAGIDPATGEPLADPPTDPRAVT